MVARFRTWLSAQGVTRGCMWGTIPRAPNHYWGAEWLRGESKSPDNVTSTFFNTVNLLPKDLRFNHGGGKLAPSNLVTPLCQCLSCWFKKSLCWVCNNAIIAKHCELERHNWYSKSTHKRLKNFLHAPWCNTKF